MTREAAAIHAVDRLLEAAAEVARDPAIVDPLVASTGLSPEGVRLALRCLETDASASEVVALVRRARVTPRVHVILSASVFTSPLRALAVARAASDTVTVSPSRRDPVFTRALVAAAQGAGVLLAESLAVADVPVGEIHAYGRDETVLAVQAGAQRRVLVRAHGAGLGIALVSNDAELAVVAPAIADDVVLFDQRGCLSPRVVVSVGDVRRAEELAARLDAGLEALGRAVPRGPLDDGERREATRYVETLSFAGRVFSGKDHVVGLAGREALLVPPPGRHIHVVAATDLEAAQRLVLPIARLVVAVGSDDDGMGQALVRGGDRVRVSGLGRMQRPRLDGPVDLR